MSGKDGSHHFQSRAIRWYVNGANREDYERGGER